MSDVRKIATTIMVGGEVFETNPISVRMENIWADMWHEMEMTRLHGPLLGPGRNELWRIEAPIRRRQRIRDHAFALMRGKRPGRFVHAR